MFTFILTAAPVSSIQFIIADAFSAALLKKRQNYPDDDDGDDHYADHDDGHDRYPDDDDGHDHYPDDDGDHDHFADDSDGDDHYVDDTDNGEYDVNDFDHNSDIQQDYIKLAGHHARCNENDFFKKA